MSAGTSTSGERHYRGHRVAVVMPAFNVEAQIARAVRSVPSFVAQIVVVDDASNDGTVAAAAKAAAGDRRVELVRHERNGGVGEAIISGYEAALAARAEIIAVMAGDAQMDPADLPQLLDAVIGGADYAKGNRFAHPDVWRVMPRTRLVGNLGLSLLSKVSSGYWSSFDSQCGYTAISREALSALLADGSFFSRYGYVNDILGRLGALGARVVDVPVRPVYADEPSGVGVHTGFHPILSVLARSLGRRMWRRYVTRDVPGRAATA